MVDLSMINVGTCIPFRTDGMGWDARGEFPRNRGGLVYVGIPEPRKCKNPGGDMESREGRASQVIHEKSFAFKMLNLETLATVCL